MSELLICILFVPLRYNREHDDLGLAYQLTRFLFFDILGAHVANVAGGRA